MPAIDGLLALVEMQKASGLVLVTGEVPALLVGGATRPLSMPALAPAMFDALIDEVLDPEQRERLREQATVELVYRSARNNTAFNVTAQSTGERTVLRLVVAALASPSRSKAVRRPASLESLVVAALDRGASDIILSEGRSPRLRFAGQLESEDGPVTTAQDIETFLAALVSEINRTRATHVITLEDPIEYLHTPQRSLIHQREVGSHVESFSSGLRAALRESPDVILLGEMRDLETISLALTAAETGHLVLSTLHSGTGAMAIDRIIDVFPDAQQAQVRIQLASVLRAVVTQRLLPAQEPGERVPAVEVLRASYAIAAQIRERKTHQLATQIQLGQDEGMIPLERSLVELVRTGRITRETALAAARSPEELQRWLKD